MMLITQKELCQRNVCQSLIRVINKLDNYYIQKMLYKNYFERRKSYILIMKTIFYSE